MMVIGRLRGADLPGNAYWRIFGPASCCRSRDGRDPRAAPACGHRGVAARFQCPQQPGPCLLDAAEPEACKGMGARTVRLLRGRGEPPGEEERRCALMRAEAWCERWKAKGARREQALGGSTR